MSEMIELNVMKLNERFRILMEFEWSSWNGLVNRIRPEETGFDRHMIRLDNIGTVSGLRLSQRCHSVGIFAIPPLNHLQNVIHPN